ncbi:unnamed protein product [Meganyctiphanes norvegica]|uniref:Uncharacterized protein n=1 Tax=Meganyctiphanes norvegica TaxID=48144 RepID=A0AAV2QN60_MEGNR
MSKMENTKTTVCTECAGEKGSETIEIFKLLLEQQEKNVKTLENIMITQLRDSFSSQVTGVSYDVLKNSGKCDLLEKENEILKKQTTDLEGRVAILENTLEQIIKNTDKVKSNYGSEVESYSYAYYPRPRTSPAQASGYPNIYSNEAQRNRRGQEPDLTISPRLYVFIMLCLLLFVVFIMPELTKLGKEPVEEIKTEL